MVSLLGVVIMDKCITKRSARNWRQETKHRLEEKHCLNELLTNYAIKTHRACCHMAVNIYLTVHLINVT
jgi:hypothetical protein